MNMDNKYENENYLYSKLFLFGRGLFGGFLSGLLDRLLLGGGFLGWFLYFLGSLLCWFLSLGGLLCWFLGSLLFGSFRLLCFLGLFPRLETPGSLSRCSGHFECSLLDSGLEGRVGGRDHDGVLGVGRGGLGLLGFLGGFNHV